MRICRFTATMVGVGLAFGAVSIPFAGLVRANHAGEIAPHVAILAPATRLHNTAAPRPHSLTRQVARNRARFILVAHVEHAGTLASE